MEIQGTNFNIINSVGVFASVPDPEDSICPESHW